MKTKDLTLTALASALIFVGTYFFKIPISFAGGYTHLGDGLLILATLLLGTRRGTIAAAIGMGLSDFIGGYMVWILPTICFKSLWALMVGLFAFKFLKGKHYGWYIGAILGGLLQIIGYTITKIPLYGLKPALIELPILSLQTIIGFIMAAVFYKIVRKTLPNRIAANCNSSITK